MLNLLGKILRMPRVVLTIMLLLLGSGFLAYQALPKESFPAIDIPFFYISTSQTGVSPRDAERLLAKPIEDRIIDIDGLVQYTTTASPGHASVVLEFDINSDKDEALADIRAAMDGVSGELPDDANEPTVTAISTTDIPVISVAIYGEVPERTLVQRAKELQDALEQVGTIQEVNISGDREEVLEVIIDLDRLDAYNLSAGELFDALARNNLVVAGGTLDSGQGSFNLEVPGLITSAQDVFTLPLKESNGTIVTFGDVATISRTLKDATEYAYVNGSQTIQLSITKKLGTNIIDVANTVREVTTETAKDWPQGVNYSFLLDQSETAKGLFRTLEAAVLTAVALVLIMCVATLGIRPAILVGLSIPLSFMMAFLFLNAFGMTVNMMVMFGMVIAVGVLVDDPIVVVEYAERKLAEGHTRREAYIMAARKMFVPVVAATATTLGAFVPLLFWPGIIGKFMSQLPITVIVVMAASLVSALIFMPVVGALLPKLKPTKEEIEEAELVMYPDKFKLENVKGITGGYVRFMSKLLRHPILTMVGGFSLIGAVFVAFSMNPTGVEAFPASEPEYGTINVVAIGNYSPNEIRDYLREVEAEVLQVEGIQDSVLTFGGGGGAFESGSPPNTIGQLSLQFLPWNERVPASEIFENIRARVSDIPGLEVQISAQEDGPPAGKAINLRVASDDYDLLLPAVEKLRDFVANELGDTIDVESGLPAPGIDWEITVDRVKAAEFGIGVRELSPYVQLVTSGVNLGTYRPDNADDELEIRVRLPEAERTFDALDTIRIATPRGQVPISNFISRTPVPKVPNLVRVDGEYSLAVAAGLEEGIIADDKIQIVKDWAAEQEWPEGVEVIFGGADEQISETNAFIGIAFAGAMFLIFLILLTEYNSFWQVTVTLSTVIMSTAGVLLGMLLTGMSFSAIMTGLGIVALTGIVVKNGIVLIDTYNHYVRDDGVDQIKAMLLTISQRVRPVLLTASVTALGVIPMALNIEFDFIRREIVVAGIAGSWFVHLSAALVSGLFFSTALTLIMVPVMVTGPGLVVRNIQAWRNAGKKTEAPEMDVDSAQRFVHVSPEGLVETEKNGVTVVSRQAAE